MLSQNNNYYRRTMRAFGVTSGKKRKMQQRKRRNYAMTAKSLLASTKLVYPFKQTVDYADVVQGTTETDFTVAFRLNLLDQVTSFTTIYDQYRIAKVVVRFWPRITEYQNSTGGAAVGFNSKIYTVIDYDDNTNITVSALRQYATCKEYNCFKPFRRICYPRYNSSAYNSGGSVIAASSQSGWLDCTNTDILYFGIKGAIEAAPASTSILQRWTISADYYIQFRNVR